MTPQQREEIEKKVVRKMIRELAARGWSITRIDDGGEPDEDTINPNETEAIDAIFAVESAMVYFHKSFPFGTPRGVTHYAQIVLGNSGWDCIADNTCGKHHQLDDFAEVMDHISDWCSESEGC